MPLSFRDQLREVLERNLSADDGVSPDRIAQAEHRLGIVLPSIMSEFYQHAGAAPEFQAHDKLRSPEALDVEAGFLVFMEENQNVVDWGIPMPLDAAADPPVWQRVNGETSEWYAEDMTFSEFIVKRLAFTRGMR